MEDAGWIRWIKRKYASMLRWTFIHRWKTVGFVVLLLASIALPSKLGLQTGIFSGAKNKRQFVRYDFGDFTYKSDVEKIVSRVEYFFDKEKVKYPLESIYSRFGAS